MKSKKPRKKAKTETTETSTILNLNSGKDQFIVWVADSLSRCEMLKVLSEEQRSEVARRLLEDFHRRGWAIIDMDFAGLRDKDIEIRREPVE